MYSSPRRSASCAGAAQDARGTRSRAGRRLGVAAHLGAPARCAATVAARSAARSAPARSQHRLDHALAGVEQREQQVLGLDDLVAALRGDARRPGDGLLGPLGGLVHGHQTLLLVVRRALVTHAARSAAPGGSCRAAPTTSCPRAARASARSRAVVAPHLVELVPPGRGRAARRARARRSRSSTRSTPARFRPSSESSWMRRRQRHVGLGVDAGVARACAAA